MNNGVLSPLVLLHWLLTIEFLLADVTFKWTVVGVSPFMHPEISLLRILLATDFAGKGLFASVCHQVPLHRSHTHKLLSAYSTNRNHFGGSFSVS